MKVQSALPQEPGGQIRKSRPVSTPPDLESPRYSDAQVFQSDLYWFVGYLGVSLFAISLVLLTGGVIGDVLAVGLMVAGGLVATLGWRNAIRVLEPHAGAHAG